MKDRWNNIKHNALLSARRALDCVAVLALLLSLAYMIEEGSLDVESPETAQTETTRNTYTSAPENQITVDSIQTVAEQTEAAEQRMLAALMHLKRENGQHNEAVVEQIVGNVIAEVAKQINLSDKPEETVDTGSSYTLHHPVVTIAAADKKRYRTAERYSRSHASGSESKVSFGLYSGIGPSLGNGSMPGSIFMNSGGGTSAASGVHTASFPLKAENYIDKTNYRQPVRLGARVSYPLNNRFALETGLNYTALEADTKTGYENDFTATNQELHYIGIPLNLRMKVWHWNALDFYLTAGGMAEKCVGGHISTYRVTEGQELSRIREHQTEKPLQWSTNFSAGLQCNFTPSIGLFVEPGMSYYFDNGSSVRTIYKDKPFNFNLNLGLRIGINK